MYIQLISVHGLVRGADIEMGRDSDTGGQVRYVLELAKTLASFEEVDQVDLFTRLIRDKAVSPDYAEPMEPLGDKARIVRLPCGGGKYMRKERLWPHLDDFVDGMIAFTRREGRMPAVVHGHYADAGYIASEVASAFGAPLVFTGHSLGRDKLAYLLEQGMDRAAADREFNIELRIRTEETVLAAADMVVASTRHERDAQYRRYDNGAYPHFEVIPPGTDLERFFPYYEYEVSPEGIDASYKQARMRMRGELQRFYFQPDKPMILALCRPDKRKNIGALVQAYGEDYELQAMANLAIFAGIRKNIADLEDGEREVLTDILLMMDRYDLYGKMAVPKRHESEKDVPELYRLAASSRGVFVNSAYVEPFGLTYIESSAVGLPFVGTENGGPQDIVENCESGTLVDVADSKAIAAAIKAYLADRDRWNRASENGVNRVREHYAWETHCRRYLDSAAALTARPSKAAAATGLDTPARGQRLATMASMLITDIDNTLLGDDDRLRELLELLAANRETVGFGVATGRHIDSVKEVLAEHGIEDIDVIIASVGTEIYYGPDFREDKGWASHLKVKWRPDRIREALGALPFLTLQKDKATQREFKISYDLDAAVDPDEALPLVYDALSKARAAHTLLFSHGTFVDILPHRASKGKAIRYLSGKWNIPIERIATAGDSGNDMDMLKGATAGIVVGNYVSELEPLRQNGGRVYFAEAANAGGILEGLAHYGFVEEGVGHDVRN